MKRAVLCVVSILGLTIGNTANADTGCVQNPRCDFHFPNSSQQRLDPAWLANLSKETLWEARNEIMARHGYTFVTPRAVSYFSAKPYYRPSTKNVKLSAIELYNVNLIKSFEDGKHRPSPARTSTSTKANAVVHGLDPVGDGFLSVRSVPNSGGRQLGALLEGDRVTILDRSGDWIKVRYWGGEGWAHQNWLSSSSPTVATGVALDGDKQQLSDQNVLTLQRDIAAMSQQISELGIQLKNHKSSAGTEDHSTEQRVEELLQRKKKAEDLVARYATPIRPDNANQEENARQASEKHQKVPYFIPGTSTTGEVWIEPSVNDAGHLVFNWNFVDPGAEYQKIAVSIPMQPDDVKQTALSLRKIIEWSVSAQQNKIRRTYEKSAFCFPTQQCASDVSNPVNTSLIFKISEDGSTSAVARRKQGSFERSFGFSIESAISLASYMDRVLQESTAEHKGATASQSDLDTLFK